MHALRVVDLCKHGLEKADLYQNFAMFIPEFRVHHDVQAKPEDLMGQFLGLKQGPFTITQLINDTNVEYLANNNCKIIIHVDRIKLLFSPEQREGFRFKV